MKLLLLFTALFLLTACAKNKTKNTCGVDCSSVGACTAVYLSFKVKIKNSDGSVYKLDSFATTRVEDDKIVVTKNNISAYDDSVSRGKGEYLVFSDGHTYLTNECGKEFNFTGYKNSIEVINEKYVFNHDCCHMQIVSGKLEIVK
jgi:hypothetical protein